jgi:hypothetical protein
MLVGDIDVCSAGGAGPGWAEPATAAVSEPTSCALAATTFVEVSEIPSAWGPRPSESSAGGPLGPSVAGVEVPVPDSDAESDAAIGLGCERKPDGLCPLGEGEKLGPPPATDEGHPA